MNQNQQAELKEKLEILSARCTWPFYYPTDKELKELENLRKQIN